MLQHSPDVREGSGVASEWRQPLHTAVLQLQPAVTSFVHQQRSEVLRSLPRVVVSGSGHGESDTQHAATTARITSDCDEGRLRTQDRHKADGVSDIRSARKCACLCGMRGGELLLTLAHRLLTGNAQRGDAADLLANGC